MLVTMLGHCISPVFRGSGEDSSYCITATATASTTSVIASAPDWLGVKWLTKKTISCSVQIHKSPAAVL